MKNYVSSKSADYKKAEETEVWVLEYTEEQKKAADNLRESFLNYFDFFERVIYPEYIRIYEHEWWCTYRRHALLVKAWLSDKSNISYPLIPAIHETYFSNTYDAQSSIKAFPNEKVDLEKVKASQNVVEWAMTTANWDETIKMMDDEATLIWPWYGKVWFLDKNKDIAYIKDGKEIIEKSELKKPTLEYVDVFSLCFNPYASSFDTASKFFREILPLSEIKTRYSQLFELKEEEWKYITQYPDFFSSKDYKKVRLLKGQEDMIKEHNSECCKPWYSWKMQEFTSDNIFNVDYTDSIVETVEFRDPINSKFVVFVNWYMVHDWYSPYPIEWDPFVRVAYKEQVGSLFPRWIWQKIEHIQINVNNFVNNWIDSVNQYANPSFIADKWVFGQDTPEVLKIRPWKVYERVLNKYIDVLKTVDNNAVNSLLSWIQFYVNQAYEIVWLNSYTQWWQWKVERVAWWVNQRVQVLKTALIPFFNNKNRTLSRIAEKRLAMSRVLMWDKFTIRLLWPQDTIVFKDIKTSDLLSKVDFAFDNQWLKSISQKEERDDIIQALQYTQDPMTRAVLEKRLLATFNLQEPTIEEKKDAAKTQFILMQLSQTGQETSPWQSQEWMPNIPEQNMPISPNENVLNQVPMNTDMPEQNIGRPQVIVE